MSQIIEDSRGIAAESGTNPPTFTSYIWRRKSVWILLMTGLALRLVLVAYYTPRQTWTGDPRYYLQSGKTLAATGSYTQDPANDKMPGMAAVVALGCRVGAAGCRYLP